MSKAHRLKTRKHGAVAKGLPLNFLLGCSDGALTEFELARLAEVADLRKKLHDILDRTIDAMTQAAMASWFKSQDRNSLKDAVDNEETPEEWAKRMIRDGQRSKEELNPAAFLPSMPPGEAHRAASVRYSARNIEEGKCAVCPQPLDPNSVRFCTKHLAAARAKSARQRGVKGEAGSRDYLYGEITESQHGRTPGTLASLEMNREKKTRAVLAELGIPPESAAVSLKAAKEALLAHMPDKAHAMTQAQLFEMAGVVTKTTGQRALNQLLAECKIERIGKGGPRELYRYFKRDA